MSLLVVALLLSAQTISVDAIASDCVDNPNYTTKLGLTCDQHTEWKCEGFASAGFAPDEVDELLTNCPVSCGTCEGAAGQRRQQMDVLSRKQQMRQTVMDELKGRVDIVDLRRNTVGNKGNNIAQQQQREVQELQACHPGWSPICQDDPTYRSQLDLPCWAHEVIDCKALVEIHFTEQEVMDLVEHCPCACKTECGTYTLSPTSSPTDTPTITKKPSDSPTTLQPTPAPTPHPSEEPSSDPSSEPSSDPSSEPSKEPSSDPSSEPSSEPSEEPTTVPTTPIIVAPRMETPQKPQEDDEHNAFSFFIIAGIAAGGVAFAVLAAILFFKMGRGPRTPSTTMPPKSKKKTKGMHKLMIAELQRNSPATGRSEGGGSEDSGNHDGVEVWMENPTVSKAETVQHHKVQRQLRAYNDRPRQALRDDISIATKDIGNVEVELGAYETSQRAQQGPGTNFRRNIGKRLSPRANNKSWYDVEHGEPYVDEGASEDDTSFDQSQAVEEAMVAARSASRRCSTFSSAGSVSRGATIVSHNTRRKEDLVYKGTNKAGKSPEVEIICAPETKTPAKVGFFDRLFRKKESTQQELAGPVQDNDLEDCNTLGRFTAEGHTFDGPVDTNPSGILRGIGSDTAGTVKCGVSFGPKTKFGSSSEASMGSGSTHPSKNNPGFCWNATDESGACIEHTITCGKSKLLRRESSGTLPKKQDGAPMNAPRRLSAIPTLNTTMDDATMEAGEVERQLSRSSISHGSGSKSKSGSRRGVDTPTTSKGSLASSSTGKTPRASHSSLSKSKARSKSTNMAPPVPGKTPRASHSSLSKSKARSKPTDMAPPVPSTRSTSASMASAKSASQAVGRIRSLPKSAKPKANRLIAQAAPYDDGSITEKDLGIAMVQAPMRMQASIATEEKGNSTGNSFLHSEPTAKNHNRSKTSQSSRSSRHETKNVVTEGVENKGENEWHGTCESTDTHDAPVASVKSYAFARIESGITTPTTIQPSQSALKHIDASPSYESTYNGKPRTSEKYKNGHREEEARHGRHSSRHRSSSRHRHHREHREDRPPRSSSRRREHSRERYHDDRRRDRQHHDEDRRRSRSHSRRREEHSERRHRSRSQSRRHHHDDYTHEDRRRSRSRDERRHRESSRHRHHEGALFTPKIPFIESDSTGSS